MVRVHTLNKKEEFEAFRSSRNRVEGRYLRLFWIENDADIKRFGLKITKKSGNAVFRNRIRRIIKETIRLNLDNLPNYKNYLLIVKKRLSDIPPERISQDLRTDLLNIFRRIRR